MEACEYPLQPVQFQFGSGSDSFSINKKNFQKFATFYKMWHFFESFFIYGETNTATVQPN